MYSSEEPSTNIYSHFVKPNCLPTWCLRADGIQLTQLTQLNGGKLGAIVYNKVLFEASFFVLSILQYFTPEHLADQFSTPGGAWCLLLRRGKKRPGGWGQDKKWGGIIWCHSEPWRLQGLSLVIVMLIWPLIGLRRSQLLSVGHRQGELEGWRNCFQTSFSNLPSQQMRQKHHFFCLLLLIK